MPVGLAFSEGGDVVSFLKEFVDTSVNLDQTALLLLLLKSKANQITAIAGTQGEMVGQQAVHSCLLA